MRTLMATVLFGVLVASGGVALAQFQQAHIVDMFYPSEGGWATWAFEDNWPAKGDYDFNDLVVRYRLALRTVDSKVNEMRITAAVMARGASFRSGFAINLPIPQSAGALASLGCPGTVVTPIEGEDATTTYVIIPDTSTVLAAEGCIFFNTDDTEGCNGSGAEFTLTIALPANSGISANTLAMGVNPFIFRVGDPGIEVHLPGFAPTAAADASLFGTKDDATTVDDGAPTGNYYLTATNLPWAIDVPVAWLWPMETTDVVAAYSNFADWAQSNGRESDTWYSDPSSFSGTVGSGSRWMTQVSIPNPCSEAFGVVTVPGASFWQGCNSALDTMCWVDFETPYHEVTVPTFDIGKSEVTVGEYRKCVEALSCTAPKDTSWSPGCNWGALNRENYPVNCVDWYQSKAYCEWAGKRLCSESEWELASRGTDGRIYPWGNALATCEYAVMYDLELGSGCGANGTMAVWSKPAGASPYGALDMSGNVFEWVEDDWHENYTGAPTDGSAWVDVPRASYRVARGGSFVYVANFLRSSSRGGGGPDDYDVFVGVRCCRSPVLN